MPVVSRIKLVTLNKYQQYNHHHAVCYIKENPIDLRDIKAGDESPAERGNLRSPSG